MSAARVTDEKERLKTRKTIKKSILLYLLRLCLPTYCIITPPFIYYMMQETYQQKYFKII
jgi:hypothetical protein